MIDYIALDIDDESYDQILIWLSSRNIAEHNAKNGSDVPENKNKKKVLIDQLLSKGNGNDRFVSCELKNGELDPDTVKAVLPTESCRKILMEWFGNRYWYNRHPILTKEQIQITRDNNVLKGILRKMRMIESKRELVALMLNVFEIDVDDETKKYMDEHFEEYFGGMKMNEIRNLLIWKISEVQIDCAARKGQEKKK